MKKIAALCLVAVMFICLPVFSFASDVTTQPSAINDAVYTDIPEPIPEHNIKYFVITKADHPGGEIGSTIDCLFQFSVYGNWDLGVTAYPELYNGVYYWSFLITAIDPNYDPNSQSAVYPGEVYILRTRLATGAFLQFRKQSLTNGTTSWRSSYAVQDYNNIICYGVDLAQENVILSGLKPKTAKVYWSERSNYNFQQELMNTVLPSLSTILSSVDSFTQYIFSLLGDVSDQIAAIDDLIDDERIAIKNFIYWYKNTYYPFIDDEIDYIELQLDTQSSYLYRIIELLGGDYEETTIPQPSQESDIEELASRQDAIQGNISSGLDQAVQNFGAVFTGNGAFALIKTGFESFILGNNKINALLVFCLSLGIGVLLIGRKIG